MTGVKAGIPLLADGRTLSVKNVIWCTGYHHEFPWIDLPIFDKGGDVVHQAGIIHNVPGIYFVGLNFLYSMTSATLMGIGRDSERVVDALWRRMNRSLVNDRIDSAAEVA